MTLVSLVLFLTSGFQMVIKEPRNKDPKSYDPCYEDFEQHPNSRDTSAFSRTDPRPSKAEALTIRIVRTLLASWRQWWKDPQRDLQREGLGSRVSGFDVEA